MTLKSHVWLESKNQVSFQERNGKRLMLEMSEKVVKRKQPLAHLRRNIIETIIFSCRLLSPIFRGNFYSNCVSQTNDMGYFCGKKARDSADGVKKGFQDSDYCQGNSLGGTIQAFFIEASLLTATEPRARLNRVIITVEFQS